MEKYDPTLPLTDHTDQSEDDCERLEPQRSRIRAQKSPCIHILYAFVLLFCSLVSLYVGSRGVDLDAKCAAYTAEHSPLLSTVKVRYKTTTFNGSFMQESIYRQSASPAVDGAWEDLGVDYRAGVISDKEGYASGLTQQHVRRAQKYGGGFLVNVEGMHHLHCLNLLRKSLYFNFDYYKTLGQHAFTNDEVILRLHITHCLDTIRQVLMCNTDTGVLGQVWVNHEKPIAFPDFNTKHKCKNYDAIRTWAQDHQAPALDQLPPDYLEFPASDIILDSTP